MKLDQNDTAAKDWVEAFVKVYSEGLGIEEFEKEIEQGQETKRRLRGKQTVDE